MDDFDLGKALREYRSRMNATVVDMARLTGMSRSKYYRIESGEVIPSYKVVQEIRRKINLDPESDQEAPLAIPQKWYRSKKMRWFYPFFHLFLFWNVLNDSRGAMAGYGGEEVFKNNPPYGIMVILGMIYLITYWWYFPPQWWEFGSRKSEVRVRRSEV